LVVGATEFPDHRSHFGLRYVLLGSDDLKLVRELTVMTLEDRPDQCFLAREVAIERALGDPNLARDVPDARVRDALVDEEMHSRFFDPISGVRESVSRHSK